MKLNFDQIEIAGFKSYQQTVSIDLAARGTGLHFVRGRNLYQPDLGSNGAGKSTIWSALCWCLYGQTIEGLRNPDVQPWIGQQATRVSVRLRTDAQEHRVTRTIKPNSLELDDRTVGQESVDQLLRIPFEVFSHTILLGQEQPLFFDLKPAKKLDLMSEVLKLDRWDNYAATATQRVRRLDETIAGAEGEATGLQRELARVTQQFDEARERSRKFQEERTREIEGAGAKLDALRIELEQAQALASKADLDLDSAGTELKALQVSLQQHENDLSAVQKNYDDFKRKDWMAREKVAQITKALGAPENWTNKVAKGLQQQKDGKCPVCGQSLTERNRESLRKDLEHWQKQVGIPQVTSDKLKSFTDTVRTLRTAEQDFRAKVDLALGQLKMYQPQVTELETQIRVLEHLRNERRESQDPHADMMKSLRQDQQRLTQAARELQTELKLLQRKHARAKVWIKGFSEVRLYIVNDILQELQLMTAGLLGEFGLANWQVHYAVEQETKSGTTRRGINVQVLSPDNAVFVNWKSWSSGEGQRLRVIGALALSEVLLAHVGVEPGIEILDEPTAHLSPEGIDDLCELLAARARLLRRQIWFTDHKVLEGAVFASVLTVKKTKAGSTIS
jgi:DNA repair exonuclease SbcCD ATPase subunit